ncbi:MAG: hypothetical protein Q4E51_08655 [Lachnospiraceae bacterium]|nr:hypothetical protein [Lachnospiraceae bacterium]
MKVLGNQICIEVTQEELDTKIREYLDCNPPTWDMMDKIKQDYIDQFLANVHDYIGTDNLFKIHISDEKGKQFQF